ITEQRSTFEYVKVRDVIPLPLAAVSRPLCPPPQKNISGLSIKREGAPAFAGPGYSRFSSDESRPSAQLRCDRAGDDPRCESRAGDTCSTRSAIVCTERPPLRFGELDRTGTTTPARRYSQALSRMNCRAEMQGAECDSVTR